jgi:hypothetical protein
MLIARFPGTEYSHRAQVELRSSQVIKTRKEESAEAFKEAEKIYFFDNDPKAAVQAYYNVYKKFPDLALGPKSLYAAAWITDNDLQKKKVAKSLYEKICDRYPQSEYCTGQAKPRIKVVLDTLEALRKANKGGEGAIFGQKAVDSAKQGPSAIRGAADSTASGRKAVGDSAKPGVGRGTARDSVSGPGKSPVLVDTLHPAMPGAQPPPTPAQPPPDMHGRPTMPPVTPSVPVRTGDTAASVKKDIPADTSRR